MVFISKKPALWMFNNTVVMPNAHKPSGAGLEDVSFTTVVLKESEDSIISILLFIVAMGKK